MFLYTKSLEKLRNCFVRKPEMFPGRVPEMLTLRSKPFFPETRMMQTKMKNFRNFTKDRSFLSFKGHVKNGFSVDVVMTTAAKTFVGSVDDRHGQTLTDRSNFNKIQINKRSILIRSDRGKYTTLTRNQFLVRLLNLHLFVRTII